MFMPTGDIAKDMEIIKAFYADIRGKYPDKSLNGPRSGTSVP
jgi:hypothetical protein